MNIDITNYGHYRLTSHGGRSFELFNRKTDKVKTITKDGFEFIKKIASWEDHDPVNACDIVMSGEFDK